MYLKFKAACTEIMKGNLCIFEMTNGINIPLGIIFTLRLIQSLPTKLTKQPLNLK